MYTRASPDRKGKPSGERGDDDAGSPNEMMKTDRRRGGEGGVVKRDGSIEKVTRGDTMSGDSGSDGVGNMYGIRSSARVVLQRISKKKRINEIEDSPMPLHPILLSNNVT